MLTDQNHYRVLLAEAEKLLTDSATKALRDRIQLRDAVCAYFRDERSKGVELGVILLSVESILKRAEARAGMTDGTHELAQQLIDWCLEIDRGLKIV